MHLWLVIFFFLLCCCVFCDLIAGVSFGQGKEVSCAEAVIPLLHKYSRGKVGGE